jgi:hypothetical protein
MVGYALAKYQLASTVDISVLRHCKLGYNQYPQCSHHRKGTPVKLSRLPACFAKSVLPLSHSSEHSPFLGAAHIREMPPGRNGLSEQIG